MELRRYRDGDFDLTEALETDPRAMADLGGSTARSRPAEPCTEILTEVYEWVVHFLVAPRPHGTPATCWSRDGGSG
jgi:hypothetical protein